MNSMDEAYRAMLPDTGGRTAYTWSPTVGGLPAGSRLVDNHARGARRRRGYSFGLRLSDAQTRTAGGTHAFGLPVRELDGERFRSVAVCLRLPSIRQEQYPRNGSLRPAPFVAK